MENETLRAFRERRSERLREKARRDNEEFESKHPRDENGKFTSGNMHATTKDTPKIRAVVRAEAISKKMGITLKASGAKEFREIFHKARGNVKKKTHGELMRHIRLKIMRIWNVITHPTAGASQYMTAIS